MPKPLRDPQPMLERAIADWGGHEDLWLFGYGSLIWRPDFGFTERRPAWVHGWHRALKMWSRVNRGSVQVPGLVFGLLSGGSVRGMVFRVPKAEGLETLRRLWLREMPTGVYDPKWLQCGTAEGPVRALAFTLSRRSPNFTGELSDERYRYIFANAVGRYGSSLDYAQQTLAELRRHAIHDAALARLVALAATQQEPPAADCDAPQAPVYVPESPDKPSQPSSGPSKENT
ncbi:MULTISPECIES: gamma-glutamylcyclotransferase [Variovorax]|jgi:glutathione-specific gamma-glutamylcyclotransferase|uniref:gamma-glutamylcyclotransferase n=1 Tax=Variovorax TaxID=34072 RepID=UPI00086B6FBD|nr:MULTISPECIES: gamma-glutamylcyclotransferase [Variovorax]MBN8757597.1 gamma-glutamylcyclotransferase [Variovorax sp.]ODU13259.1 MAG: calcium transporter ChaC [Variovorax sp. SCN 67-85]ODV22057.1 MAG: calcium transporter ChaC [Variovorax sp. SCN 67-20]OJZ07773.1 MAG: calcium transporter ChaC [Variovorax sp. 67-131]UKI10622.1 gamma-glutamylcyclotransferase [Variovorax paradoxus]